MENKTNEATFQSLEELAEEIQKTHEKKKRGRPKKSPEPEFAKIELDLDRFEEERGRVIRYLDNISSRSMGTFEAISILEELGVIINTHELPRDVVLQQLRNALNTVYKRR